MAYPPSTAIASVSLAAVLVAGVAAQQPEKTKPLDTETIRRLLRDEKPAEVRRAAESVRQLPPKDREQLVEVADAIKSALSTTRDADAEAALRLALGKLAAA